MSINEQQFIATASGEERAHEATNDQKLVSIQYFTDPLCSWSWAFEAQWRRLRYECAERLDWRYRMGGLIANWSNYEDPLNDVRTPTHMGPQWFQVQEASGMPLDDRLWRLDPPASSYPCCVAVKAAERQGKAATESYLRRLREAAMIECRNIGRKEVLLTLAQELAGANLLDFQRFQQDLEAPDTLETFRQDLRDAAYYGIGRFPTLILQRGDGRGIVLMGYRPYAALQAALEHLVPGIIQHQDLSPEELAIDYIGYWQRAIAREVGEILDCDTEHSSALLETLVARSLLTHEENIQSKVPMYIRAR